MTVESNANLLRAGVPLLEVDHMVVRYGHLEAVRDISLSVMPGELITLLGANGAGKSSLMKAIVGLVPMASGSASLEGRSMNRLNTSRRAQLRIGYLPEGRGVFPTLTVEENILLGVTDRAVEAEALESAYQLFPVLGNRRRQTAGSMSGGEQQMLSLSRALAGNPRLLLLDELSLGLAPMIVAQLLEKVGELRNGGISVVIVEQFAHAVLRIADRAGIIVRGSLTRLGPASDLVALSPNELAKLYFVAPADG